MKILKDALPDGYTLHHMMQTESTNSDAIAWVEGGQAPKALFVADSQTAGRGRRGRDWSSPSGNIYASLTIPAPADVRQSGHFGFVISLAIQRAIDAHLPAAGAKVKWPNDVLLNGKKCAGILMEIAHSPHGHGLVIGFGVNIAHAPEGTAYPTAKLNDYGDARTPFEWLAAIIDQFFQLAYLPLPELLDAWRAVAEGIGREITVNLPNSSISGIFQDIDSTGALLLETGSGIQKYYTGDVFFKVPA